MVMVILLSLLMSLGVAMSEEFPRWFNASLSIYFHTDELVEFIRDKEGIVDVTIDDLLIEIDDRLYQEFGRSTRNFVVSDDSGEEY
jgi:hypothetical protein